MFNERRTAKCIGVWVSSSELALLQEAAGNLKLATFMRDAALKAASRVPHVFPIETGYDTNNYEGDIDE